MVGVMRHPNPLSFREIREIRGSYLGVRFQPAVSTDRSYPSPSIPGFQHADQIELGVHAADQGEGENGGGEHHDHGD